MTFPFAGQPDREKSDVLRICDAERDRQWRHLIMIPSESICHPAAAEILAGEFGNIYAEGLPQPILCHDPSDSAVDENRFQSWQNRLSDRRFYKGTINANRAELAAHKYIAEVFASLDGSPAAGEIHANVQPLSGAAANLAVYEALLEPGDRLMGLDLSHGGHLTHGSEFNFSGKTYDVCSYGIDETTRRLDYDRIREQALVFRPRMIIGGASAYPWDFDWAVLREIADEVGAYLLADVAHLAGLVAAGLLNNPLPHAHVVTFTTHKTLCGPRGAVILTTRPELAKTIDMAVFPGLQGGPHMNSIAAIARLFELIAGDRDAFRGFQKTVLDNTLHFAQCMTADGFTLEYGGTNTHMLLVDLKKFTAGGETHLDGETASRLLEIAGVVCNKNVIPGDADAAHATGLRFGLPWLTQRGVTRDQLREIAGIIRSVLEPVRTIAVWSPSGEQRCRGRVPAGVLEETAEKTLAVAEALPYPPRDADSEELETSSRLGDRTALLVRGDKVHLALDEMLTARLPVDGTVTRSLMLDSDGNTIDDVLTVSLEPSGREERWVLLLHAACAAAVRRRIEALSDGYLLFDEDDLQQKIAGPSVVEEMDVGLLPRDLREQIETFSGEPQCDPTKPYFIGQRALYAEVNPSPRKKYEYTPEELPLRKTVFNHLHHELGAKMAPFAGWEMPIQYPTGILAEHRAVRTTAGLFDVSHMSVFEISGAHAPAFLEALLAGCVSRLDPGQAQYSCMLYPDGTTIDDVYLYRIERERFLLVSNASNAERVGDWIQAVNSRRFIIDEEMPAKEIDGPVEFRDLRHAGKDSLVGVALQGPVSLDVLKKLTDKRSEQTVLERLVQNTTAHIYLAGSSALVGRTGYTGEKMGFEIYVHPREAGKFWGAILDEGRDLGVLPAGLGARDSTRTEAGLPLFGYEIEGELGASIAEAGYGFVLQFHVPFFIGRGPCLERVRRSRRHILRLGGQGRKSIRPGHVIVDGSDKKAGTVTSFAYVDEEMTFVALALADEGFQPEPGEMVKGIRIPADKFAGALEDRSTVELTVLTRFPENTEEEWRG